VEYASITPLHAFDIEFVSKIDGILNNLDSIRFEENHKLNNFESAREFRGRIGTVKVLWLMQAVQFVRIAE